MHRNAFIHLVTRLARRVGCSVVLSVATAALAQDLTPASGLLETTQQWVDAALRNPRATDSSPLRMQVSLGQLDTRLRLAPCVRIEPYLPVNTHLWGKTRIGLRCLEGSTRWNVFLPLTVKAMGLAWVLRGAVAQGSALKLEDATQAEVDWASEASPILGDSAQWVGQVAAYPLLADQPLRQAMVRPAQAFQAGAAVRVLAQGVGFSVSSDAQALTSGVVGQMVRVRTESGRVVSGVVLDARTVKITL